MIPSSFVLRISVQTDTAGAQSAEITDEQDWQLIYILREKANGSRKKKKKKDVVPATGL